MTKIELDEFLMRDKPRDFDYAGNAGMLGSIMNITNIKEIPGASAFVFQHGRYMPTPEHGHTCYEMMYVYNGSITQYIDGVKIVLRKGAFCLLDPNTKHSIETCGKEDIAVNFIFLKSFFTSDFFSRIADNNLFYDFFAGTLHNTNTNGRYLVINADDNMLVRELAAMAMCESFEPDICTKGSIESMIPILLNELFRIWRNKDGRKIQTEPDAAANIWRILQYIQTHCATATLPSTAHRFGYAPNYLSTLLTKTTGNSFTDIRQKACVDHATMLLVSSDIPVGEIARSVGITNISFFYTLFHRYFFMTPAEYRLRHRKCCSAKQLASDTRFEIEMNC